MRIIVSALVGLALIFSGTSPAQAFDKKQENTPAVSTKVDNLRAHYYSKSAIKPVPLPKPPARTYDGSRVKTNKIISVAKKYVGVPYVHGGTTPRGFDCSGYTKYVYAKALHRNLPRTANSQYRKSHRVTKSQAKPGDLVFFIRGGRAYHVGIYAGKGQIYDAPRSGKRISKRQIWKARVVFGKI